MRALPLVIVTLALAGCLFQDPEAEPAEEPALATCPELAGAPCGPGSLQPLPEGTVPDGWLCIGRFGVSVLGDEARGLHMEFWRDTSDGRGLRWDMEGYPGSDVQHIRTLVSLDGGLETWDHWTDETDVDGFVEIDPYEEIRVQFLMASVQHGDSFRLGVNETDHLRYILYQDEGDTATFVSAIPSGRIAWRADGSVEEPEELTYDDHTAGPGGGVAFLKWSDLAVLTEPQGVAGATTCPPGA